MEKFRIDMRKPEEADPAEGQRCLQLCFKKNQTMPSTDGHNALVKALFMGNIVENAVVGSGTVVTKDVDDNTVVGGNPTKVLNTHIIKIILTS